MLKQVFVFLGNYFLFGNFLAALGAAGLCYATAFILHMNTASPMLLNTAVFIFAAVLLVYNADRLIAAKYDRHSKRHYWIKNNRFLLATTAILTIPVLARLSFVLPLEAVLAALALGLLAFAYSFPILINYHVSLKERGFLKVFLIALVWGLATTILPVLAAGAGGIQVSELLLLASERFLFILPIAIISDMRDMRADKAAMIVTLPLRYGWRKTLRTCIYICAGFIVLSLLHYHNDFVPLGLPHLLSGIYLLILVFAWHHKRKELYYSGLLDGSVLLHALLVLLFGSYFL